MKNEGIKLKLLMFILTWWEANSLLTIQGKIIEKMIEKKRIEKRIDSAYEKAAKKLKRGN